MRREFEWVDFFRARIPKRLQGAFGIGDDAGGLAFQGGGPLLFACDTIVEGVDFIRKKARPEDVGRKALAVNLSDLAAMAARPLGFVIALGLPPDLKNSWVERFYSGLIGLAREWRVPCLGGDLSRAREIFCSVSILGTPSAGKSVLRSGARPGDWIGVTGTLGGSILGRHFLFEPRLHEAEFLARRFRPSAMIDISDGLLQDLGHLLKASGAGAELYPDSIPVSREAFQLSRRDPAKAFRHALSDGEDFELLFTCAPARRRGIDRVWKKHFPRTRLSWIGRIRQGKRLAWFDQGRRVPTPVLTSKGYSHF